MTMMMTLMTIGISSSNDNIFLIYGKIKVLSKLQ